MSAERIAQLETYLMEMAQAGALGTLTGIHCIKAYRMATGAGLRDAKDWYDRLSGRSVVGTNGDARFDRIEVRLHALERRMEGVCPTIEAD
jgi:hypothetical protein